MIDKFIWVQYTKTLKTVFTLVILLYDCPMSAGYNVCSSYSLEWNPSLCSTWTYVDKDMDFIQLNIQTHIKQTYN